LRREKEMQPPKISVIIPAYNEENTVGKVIAGIIFVMSHLGLPFEVIVVDDGSIDGTRKAALAQGVTVLSNERNRGKGYAVRRGLLHAKGDIIITIDADGAHSPGDIVSLVHPLLNGVDIAAGSRFLGNEKDFTSKLNLIGNVLFNTAIAILTGKQVTDSQTGLRGFKKDVLRNIRLESCGYEIETEITVKGLKNGFRFMEVPIACSQRKGSQSKLKPLPDGIRILKTILKANFGGVIHDAA
jgi:glycosyltransferase involved in cell wall biosynthesis